MAVPKQTQEVRDMRQASMLAALEREAEGYKMRGLTDREKDVKAYIAAVKKDGLNPGADQDEDAIREAEAEARK